VQCDTLITTSSGGWVAEEETTGTDVQVGEGLLALDSGVWATPLTGVSEAVVKSPEARQPESQSHLSHSLAW
jgi:hypothetical protein